MMKKKRLAGMLGAALLAAGLAGQVYGAQKTGPGVKSDVKDMQNQPIAASFQAAQETDQIILVTGDGSGSSRVTVSYFKKNGTEGWSEVFAVPGYCGYNGITGDKKEGDRKTPSGDYRFNLAFGIYENPDSVMPYRKVKSTDYWVDDSSSPYYNKLVDTAVTAKSWNSAEHLSKIVPQYHYVLSLDYNSSCVPGQGSAIFLHGYHTTKTWTEGCVAIPEEQMKLLLQNVDENSRIIIAPGPDALAPFQVQ